MVWPGSEPRIEPRTGEKFSFNVDIHVVAATDFDEYSMASTMNSSGSIDLNRNGQ